jgi:hypothetical protein
LADIFDCDISTIKRDILNGHDIKLTTVGTDVTGTDYNKTTVSVSLKITPLTDSEDKINEFLENQPNPLDLYDCYSFDEVKQALQEFLAPEEEKEENDEEETEEEEIKPKSNYNTPSFPEKKSNSQKFNDLFEKEDPNQDDLPF